MNPALLAIALAATLSATDAQASVSVTNLIDATYGIGTGSFELGSFVSGGTGSTSSHCSIAQPISRDGMSAA